MEDRRIQKSKDAIQNSFFELLKEKSLNKITVAEICRMANVGRGTFYLHYMDVYDLYDKIESELYAGLYQLFEDAFPSTDTENSRKLSEGLPSFSVNQSLSSAPAFLASCSITHCTRPSI